MPNSRTMRRLVLGWGRCLRSGCATRGQEPGSGAPTAGGGSRVVVSPAAAKPAARPATARSTKGAASVSSGTTGGLATLTEAELTTLIVKRQPAVYPQFYRNMKMTGSVKVTLDLATDGTLMRADAVDGPEELYAAAIIAIQTWQFAPYTRNGQRVPVRSVVHFNFTDPAKGTSD